MQEIYDKLTPVRRRQKLARTLRYAGIGLMTGSLAAVLLTLASSLLALPALQWAGWAALACGLIVGLIAAQITPCPWTSAAQAVDRHFRLADRAQSAVTFMEQGKLTGLYSLQIADTAECLANVETATAVCLRPPAVLAIGSGGWTMVAVLLLLFLPQNVRDVASDAGGTPNQTEHSTRDPEGATKPLPKSATFTAAINGPTVVESEKGNRNATPTSEHETTTATELLDFRIDAAYRANTDR